MRRIKITANDLWCIAVIGLLVVMAGCASPRIEPTPIPFLLGHGYECPAFRNRLNALPVRLNLRDCIDKCVMTKSSITGNSTELPHVFAPLVEREFTNLIAANCLCADGVRKAKVELKVEPTYIDLRRSLLGTVTCDVIFSVKLLDPRDASVRPLFEKMYEKTTTCDDRNDRFIPNCIYKAIQETAWDTVMDISRDRELMRILEDLLIETPPEFISWNLKEIIPGEHQRGTTYVACNDWSKEETRRWAEQYIKRRCQDELRLGEKRFRVFFAGKNFDESTHRWYFVFDSALKANFVMFADGERRGRCFVDMGALKVDITGAMKIMERRLLAESAKTGLRAIAVEITSVVQDPDNEGVLAACYKFRF